MELINEKQFVSEMFTTQADVEISLLNELQLTLIAGGIGDVVPA